MKRLIASLIAIPVLLLSCTGSHKDKGAGATKTLYLAFGDDLRSMDPADATDMLSAELLGHIFEGLLSFSYLGKPGVLEPQIAVSIPKLNEKTRLLKFSLRRDVFFSDDPAFPNGKGREVVADDFVYSFKRVADPRLGEANWWLFAGSIEGFDEWREKVGKALGNEARDKAFREPISGLTAPSTYTLQIKLKKAYPQLLYVLGMQQTSVVAHEVVEKYGPDIVGHPVGTGPYKLKEWVHGSKITIVRNPTFRPSYYPTVGSDEDRLAGRLQASGSRIPFIDEVQWDIIKEEQPNWLKFLKGDLDYTKIPKDSFAEAIDANGSLRPEMANKGVVLYKDLSLTTWWLEFNLKDPVVGPNLNLRKALALAFDRKRALDLLYNNRGVLASGPMPPTYEGGQAAEKFPYELNVEKAKKFLAAAGFPGGKGLPELTFDIRGPGTTPRQLGELLVDNFSKIGVTLKLLGNSYQEALDKQRNAKYQIMLGGWHADYPDPETYLQLFITANKAPGSNTSNFSDPEYDKLYESVRASPPSRKRLADIGRMVEILNDKLPAVFFFHAVDYYVGQGWLKYLRPSQMLYGTSRYVDIDMEKRAKLLKEKF